MDDLQKAKVQLTAYYAVSWIHARLQLNVPDLEGQPHSGAAWFRLGTLRQMWQICLRVRARPKGTARPLL